MQMWLQPKAPRSPCPTGPQGQARRPTVQRTRVWPFPVSARPSWAWAHRLLSHVCSRCTEDAHRHTTHFIETLLSKHATWRVACPPSDLTLSSPPSTLWGNTQGRRPHWAWIGPAHIALAASGLNLGLPPPAAALRHHYFDLYLVYPTNRILRN